MNQEIQDNQLSFSEIVERKAFAMNLNMNEITREQAIKNIIYSASKSQNSFPVDPVAAEKKCLVEFFPI